MKKRCFSFYFILLYFVLNISLGFVFFDPVSSTVIASLVCLVLMSIIYHKHYRQGVTSYDISFGHFLLICCALVFIWFSISFATTWFYTTYGDNLFDGRSEAIYSNPSMYILLTLIIAPVTEELLIRGFLYNDLKRRFNPIISCVLSALLFAILHGTVLHLYIGFVAGVFFTLIYEYTGSIYYSILFHGLYNFLSLFAPNISFHPIFFEKPFVIVSNLLVFTFLILSWVFVYQRFEKN